MLRALCRSYRHAAASGFRSWDYSKADCCGGEFIRSYSSTGGYSEEKENDKAEQATSDSADTTSPTPQTDVEDALQESILADGSAKGNESEREREATVYDIEWEDVIGMWANAHACYIEKDRSILTDAKRKSDRDKTLKVSAPDGTIESAYDNTSQPLYDSRVWLHMFEGPDGKLLPSFCKRTGAAQYMYDFTEWRVEQNALLSDDAKCLMYKLWAPGRGTGAWTDEMLAHAFKIRVQRALAIVKIKELEFKAAETNVENLNKLQTLLGLDPQPTLKELHKPHFFHTPKHLTAWFDEWIQLYELLPHIIHPDSDSASPSDSSDSAESDSAGSADSDAEESSSTTAEGAESDSVEAAAAYSAAEGGAGEGTAKGETDSSSGKDKKGIEKRKQDKEKGSGDQRVKLTAKQVEEVVELHNALTKAANGEAKHIATHEDLWRTVYHYGTGEKYIPFIQTMPSFEERPAEDAAGSVGEYDTAIEDDTRVQDRQEIEEFRRNLDWALEETGTTIQRAPRKRGARGSTLPSKPEGGWPILVTPLHAGGKRGQPFVAMPDTTRRNLTADEELYLSHFKIEPRIFSRPRRHAPYTNDTLHMFTQRKPNHRHDLYNPPYMGELKHKRPRSGPDRRDQRKARMAAMRKRKDLAPLLAGTTL